MSSTLLALLLSAISITVTRGQPYFVAYLDFPTCGTLQDADCLAALGVPGYSTHPYNVINFAFYVSSQSAFYDASLVWSNPSAYFSATFRDQIAGTSGATDAEFRAAVKSLYTNAGVTLLLSVGGATDHPIANGVDATTLAQTVANLVVTYNYDGADIDWEETSYFNAAGTGETWLITLTTVLRNQLGPDYIITHAPQAPYIGCSYNAGSTAFYPQGGYLEVHQQVGDMINWYNVQFYNQGSTPYDTFNELFVSSTGWCLNNAVYQMVGGDNANGLSIPANKIVVGKFIRPGTDGSAGWVSATDMRDIFAQAIQNANNAYPQWETGFMIWQFYGDQLDNFSWGFTVAEAWSSRSPSTSPTQSPSLPPGVTHAPTTPAPVTPAPTFGEATGNLELRNSGTLNVWWYAGILSGLPDGYSIATFEIEQGSGWLVCTKQTWAFECAPTVQFVLPLSVRLTANNGEQIIATDVITSFDDQATWDLGDNFGNSATPSPVTPSPITSITPAPVTPSPISSGTPSPVLVTPSPVTPAPVTAAPTTSAPVTASPTTETVPSDISGANQSKMGLLFIFMAVMFLLL